MTTSLAAQDKTEAKKKGAIAAGTWAVTGVLLALSAPVLLTAAAAGAGGVLTYKWFMFRAKRGMRF
jgi:hypothetical protein